MLESLGQRSATQPSTAEQLASVQERIGTLTKIWANARTPDQAAELGRLQTQLKQLQGKSGEVVAESRPAAEFRTSLEKFLQRGFEPPTNPATLAKAQLLWDAKMRLDQDFKAVADPTANECYQFQKRLVGLMREYAALGLKEVGPLQTITADGKAASTLSRPSAGERILDSVKSTVGEVVQHGVEAAAPAPDTSLGGRLDSLIKLLK